MKNYGFDAEAWAQSTFEVFNSDGGRGYNQGVRVINCPFHGDTTKSGWVQVHKGRLACFNPNCEAHAGLGIVEAVRRLEGYRTWTEALAYLRREFPGETYWAPPAPIAEYKDWCRLPGLPLWEGEGPGCAEARGFCARQWGLVPMDWKQWGLRYTLAGRFAWRVIIPVVMDGKVVSFTGRTYRNGEPKYLGATYGEAADLKADCGRPAGATLFNIDAVREGSYVLLNEGSGDTMRWEAVAREKRFAGSVVSGLVSTALLGTAVTEERASILAAKRPAGLVLALDVGTEGSLSDPVEMLQAWGLPVAVGYWAGGKDAGDGATLVPGANANSLGARVRFALGIR